MKTKLSAVAAIVATVFGVMAGGAPAHATPSAYTPTAGSTWASWTGSASKTYSVTNGPGGSLGFSIPANSTLSSFNIQIPLNVQSDLGYWADGLRHTYTPQVTLTDSGSNSVPVTLSPRIWGDLGLGNNGSFSYPETLDGSAAGTYDITVTAATRTAAVYGWARFEIALNNLVNLAGGNYSLSIGLLRDGLPIASSHLETTSNATVSYTISQTDPGSVTQTYPGDTGNTGTFTVQMATCIRSNLLTAGDVLSYHTIMDGADYTEAGPPGNAYWMSSLLGTDPNYFSSVWASTVTVTSAMAAANFSVSKSIYPNITLADNGTHTVGLSITNQNGTEVSTPCGPTPNRTATVTDQGPMSQVTVSVDVRRPLADAMHVRVIDAATQATVYQSTWGYVPNSGSATENIGAENFVAGHTYNVSYRLGKSVQVGTVYGSWSTPVSYTPTAVQAPVITASGTTVTATVPGLGNTGMGGNIVVAYAPNNTNTILAGSYAFWSNTSNSTTAQFNVGSDLSYSTDYVFGWCQGGQMWNMVNNVMTSTWTCYSAVSPLTSTYTTPGLAAPTVTVSGTTANISGSAGMGGGYVIYAASNTNTAVYTTTSSMVNFMYTQGLSYGTSYVVKVCPTVSYVNMLATCTSQSLSPASSAFTVAAPAMGYTRGTITNGNAVGSAVAGSSNLTVPSGIGAAGNDGVGGRLMASISGSNVTLRHVTQAGQDSTFGGSGSIALSMPNSVMNVYSITWSGNKDKYGLVVGDVSGNYMFATGAQSGGSATIYTVSNSSLTTACTSAFGTSTNGSVGSFIPNPMGDIYVNVRCMGVPVTYADASTGTVSANAVFKITANNTLALAGKLWTPSATATNFWAASSSATSNPDMTINPTATGSATAVTFLFQTAAKSGASASNTTITSAALKVARLAADGTFTVADLATSMPFVSGNSANAIYLYELNNGTEVMGLQTNVTSQPAVYSSVRINSSSTTLSTLTMDSATAFSTGSSTLTGLAGITPTATGEVWGTRRMTGMATTYAPVKINMSTGAITTFEGVGFTMSTPSLDTWLSLGLNSSSNPSIIYSTGSGVAANMYWRTVAVSGNQQSSDASATISVNDGSSHTVLNNGTLNVSNSVTSVTTTVTPTESHATVGTITGGSNLQVGNNTVSFTVTAQDGSTQNYSFTVVRASLAPSTVATAILTVNGSTIGNGSTVNLANGTTSVAVTVTPTESHATYVVSGNTGLTTGNNSVSVVVTAQDGTTQQVYTFTAAVAASNVATATITVDGTAVADGGSIAVANATTSVTIVVTRTESHATVGAVTGGTNLAVGDNTVSFTVTAQNGTTTRNYSFTVVRLPSDATPCLVGAYSTHGGYSSVTQSWSCVDAPAGSYVSTAGASAATLCAPGYFSASVASTSCTPASLNHFVANAGATAEVACPSNTHANATGAAACDPDRVLSSNKNVTITIGGERATPGTVVNIVGIPAGRLNVHVSQDDIAARAYLSIPSNPVIGDNIVTVIVQAEDGSRTEQEITVRITEPVVTPPVVTPPVVEPPVVTPPVVTPPVVTPPVVTPPAKSSDATAVITVAGITVADGDHVNLPFGTASVPVVVTPTESHATYAVTGATGLQTGTSVLTVTVTAEDGTVKAYSYQLVVAADKSPVNLGTASASVLQQVTAALDAGRVAYFNVTAKGAAAASKALAQIRAFKTDLRAAGSTAKVSFSIKVTGANAVATVKVAP